MSPLLRRIEASEAAALHRRAVAPADRELALGIVEDVRARGDVALREHAERLGDLTPGEPWILGRAALMRSLEELPRESRELLERTVERILSFAVAQRDALRPLDKPVPGGRAGHTLQPVDAAGCYAPGGRFPLPSSVLMTACTARAAGVSRVVVASPRPPLVTRAAAALAGADQLVTVGGAQAIAALAYGTESLDSVDFVCGPGNRWVTAAKQLVFGDVGVDMLAGPSELVVLADGTANAALVAADLLAQAEHDADALPILLTLDEALVPAVEAELERQLAELGETCAGDALRNGYVVTVSDEADAVRVCEHLAPEHLEVLTSDPEAWSERLRSCGALFLGPRSAEVFGDYGVGPNHVLPTGRGSRYRGGLSVLDFLRVRTWLSLESAEATHDIVTDAAELARLEGLEAHARAAEARRAATPRTAPSSG